MSDWTTAPDGRSNSSEAFLLLVDEVERLIRGDAHSLIGGYADNTARVIVAQLAHRFHMSQPIFDDPTAPHTRPDQEAPPSPPT